MGYPGFGPIFVSAGIAPNYGPPPARSKFLSLHQQTSKRIALAERSHTEDPEGSPHSKHHFLFWAPQSFLLQPRRGYLAVMVVVGMISLQCFDEKVVIVAPEAYFAFS